MSTKETMTLKQLRDQIQAFATQKPRDTESANYYVEMNVLLLDDWWKSIDAHIASQPAEQTRGEPVAGAFYLGGKRLDTSDPDTLEYVRSRFEAKAKPDQAASVVPVDREPTGVVRDILGPLASGPSVRNEPYPDDEAVDAFADALKAKLAEARAKGRGGWNNDEPGMQQRLSNMLRDHVEKGDPRDAQSHVVVTRDSTGEIVAVTRQDDEGRILKVIAEKLSEEQRHAHQLEHALTIIAIGQARAEGGE